MLLAWDRKLSSDTISAYVTLPMIHQLYHGHNTDKQLLMSVSFWSLVNSCLICNHTTSSFLYQCFFQIKGYFSTTISSQGPHPSMRLWLREAASHLKNHQSSRNPAEHSHRLRNTYFTHFCMKLYSKHLITVNLYKKKTS